MRRLGKFKDLDTNVRRLCRPLLISTDNPYFMEKCFARSHHLKDFRMPVYIKKYLSKADRDLEKTLLSKRYNMINVEGKDRKDFRIKNLQLFYKGNVVDINGQNA